MNSKTLKTSLLSLFLVFSACLGWSQQEKYAVKLTNFNSEYSDFSPIIIDGDIIFVSDKKSETVKNKKDPATKRNFCNLYSDSKNSKIISLLDKINTIYHEGPISVSEDGNLVFFTRSSFFQKEKRYTDDKVMPLQIFYIKFQNGEWSSEYDFPINSTQYSTGHPSLSADGRHLYFTSDMPGGLGGTDIYRISYVNGEWGLPENLGQNINSSFNEMFPFISKENILYFSSNSTEGLGGLDVWCSFLNNNTISSKINMGAPINTIYDDFALTEFSRNNDILAGYLSSNRPNGVGLDDIYEWRYNIKPFEIQGVVTNTKGKIIPETSLFFALSDSIKVETKTDSNGTYVIPAIRNSLYTIEAKNENYFSNNFNLKTKVEDNTEYLKFDIMLEEFPKFKIKPIETDGTPIEGMSVSIKCDNEDVFSGISTKDWMYWEFPHRYHKGDSVHLLVEFQKTGYLNKKVNFDMVIENGGEIVIPKEKETVLVTKVEQNMEISKILELNPIYYDYDKSNIRPDAAIELNKVIKFLNDNPDLTIELSSHTDSRGNDDYNLQLSDKRAKSAAEYLKKGLKNPSQIYGKGYGESKLVNKCTNGVNCSDKDHELNRRTEFRIVKFTKNGIISQTDTLKNNVKNKSDEITDKQKNIYSDEDIVYKVQIFATSKLLDFSSEKFKKHKEVSYYFEEGLCKYTIGESKNLQEIKSLRDVLNADFVGCFIVKFKNGKRLK